MKAAPFECLVPETVEEVVAALAQHGDAARMIAGGQSLVPMMNLRLTRSEVLVDLNRVAELSTHRRDDGRLLFGSMVRQAELLRSPLVADHAALLAKACHWVGYPATRNRGTLGGSAAHADPAAELPAALIALDAALVARSARGERVIGADEFFVDYFTTALAADEFLSEVQVPVAAPEARSAFLEVARRKHDFPLCGVAVVLRRGDDGRCREARVALCAAASRPVRAHNVEAALVGAELTPDSIRSASAQVTTEISPLSDVHGSSEYRIELAVTLTRRALEAASGDDADGEGAHA